VSRKEDIEIRRGDDYELQVTLVDESGNVINNSNFTALMQLRRAPSTAVVIELTGDDGLTLGGADGIITIALTNEQTALLLGVYVYDLEIVDAQDKVWTPLYGSISITADVSRAQLND
jgi:hypothetical protein